MKDKKIMPTMILLYAILAILAVHFLLPVKIIIPPLWNLIGLLPLLLGIFINLVADRAFQAASTTVKPFEESSALLTDGVFRITRNPMYLGFVLILLGIAILLRSLSPYLIIIVFVYLIQKVYISTEEKMLAEKFGTDWQKYRQITRRWL